MSRLDNRQTRTWSPAELASLASTIYSEASPSRRLMLWLKIHSAPFDRLIDFVPEGASVLDVGCGTGLFLGLIAATGRRFRGVGFDRSADVIQIAQAMTSRVRSSSFEADLQFEHLDIHAPWPEGPFDVVSVLDVMHHVPIPHRRALFESACAALRPGGILILKDIGDRPFWRASANRLSDLLIAREWVRYTPRDLVETWGRELGLELLSLERIDRWCYGHELFVFKTNDQIPCDGE